ncbi:hypothetical protein [Methanofollis fontis]|uniref:Uncharacterized protein n=1 Tax=Methanofollis fontis TaxID=2052832 RepID=A0A483CSR3_9EURY|nr:hypothetical protein [Methanofollis fontis]TAJ44240.1 hypothetical protein CUJ86_09480 [Methanofollis fontis]
MNIEPSALDRLWLVVPAVSFGGILASAIAITVSGSPLLIDHSLWAIGKWACIIASVLLCAYAYTRKRKDLVALLAPAYAVLIFMNGDFTSGPIMQVLFAASISVLAVRVEKRFQ